MTRTSPPFSLLAYGNNQSCRLTGTAEHRTELISIGAHRARLRLSAEAGSLLRFGERCLLTIDSVPADAPVGGIPCEVAWLDGREAGVDFRDRFEASLLTLQQFLDQGQRAREEAA